jgi:hypothetical protein
LRNIPTSLIQDFWYLPTQAGRSLAKTDATLQQESPNLIDSARPPSHKPTHGDLVRSGRAPESVTTTPASVPISANGVTAKSRLTYKPREGQTAIWFRSNFVETRPSILLHRVQIPM